MTKNDNINKHGGDASAIAIQLGMDNVPDIALDFSVNINPLGSPDCVKAALCASPDSIHHYPDIYAYKATTELAQAHDVEPENVILGNGSTELMSWVLQSIKPEKPAWIAPCYSGYEEVCKATGIEGKSLDAIDENFSVVFDNIEKADIDLLFLASPNNPTGTIIEPLDILSLAQQRPDLWIIIDESFMDFVEDRSLTLIRKKLPKNIIIIKSLTKFFAIPGLRLGMAYTCSETSDLIRKSRLPWSVNAIAQQTALKLYHDKKYIEASRSYARELRDYLIQNIEGLSGWKCIPSRSNYIAARLPDGSSAKVLQQHLLQQGILIRSCANFDGLGEQYIRLAVRPRAEVDKLISAIAHPAAIKPKPHKPSSIMVVGTMSNSGKSLVSAALCRYFARKGMKTAPFKAQNMSLNSFVTKEGGEMGRAQVVQAHAAGLEPHTDMNPVLLKPLGDAGSQVIVDGQPIGNYPAKDYYAMKEQMRKAAFDSYDRLSEQYELIILEGAGSPAEINLLEEDFVNLRMAEYANAHVLLVADIDRGGVFASIYGTINLVPMEYRKLIKGIIINKFRGDISLLEPGIKQIEELTNIPVLGVLPYVRDLRIDDEDSVALDNRPVEQDAKIDIAVVRLPRISNYTDFFPLEHTLGVSLRYVEDTYELGDPDLIIIPGSKNTMSDLRHITKIGWAETLGAAEAKGTPIMGICGGFQMLGARISDPTGVEGMPGEEIGLNLLPVTTVLEQKKELAQVEGVTTKEYPFGKSGIKFKGYEIHSGRTTANTKVDVPLSIRLRLPNEVKEKAGAVSENGLVFGCYIHGLFDEQEFTQQLLDWLCKRKDLEQLDAGQASASLPEDFDHIADVLMNNVSMTKVMEMMNRKDQNIEVKGGRRCP
ncbi:cobyric acid synthase CobQ [bacterium B17]|nr:cobyric acid synthase CobQ [bacterium B17]